MPRISTTKTAQSLLAVFVFVVLVLDGVAVQQFMQSDASLAVQSSYESIAAAGGSKSAALATTTKAQGNGNGVLKQAWKKLIETVAPPVTPPPLPVVASPDPLVPEPEPEVFEPAPEDVLPPEELELPLDEDLWPEEEYVYEDELDLPFEEDLWPADELPLDLPFEYAPEPYFDTAAEPAPAAAPAKKPAAKAPAARVTTGKLPDLYLGELIPLMVGDIDGVLAYQPLGFSLRIDNAGAGEARAFTTRIRIDEGRNATWDREITIAPQGVLPASNTQRLIARSVVKQPASGDTLVEICADSTNTVAETKEDNNCRRLSFTVGAAPAPVTKQQSVIYTTYKSILNFFGGATK